MNQSTSPASLTQHPLSAAFPGMGPLELAELTNDIRENGLIQPIMLFEGQVLDGWHRHQACIKAGVEARFTDFTGTDPRRFVLSLNLNRRHLSGSQKAGAIVAVNAWAPSHRPSKEEPGSTLSEMAEEAGVSTKTIQQAKKAHAAGLGEAVKAGKVSVKKAAEIADLPEPEREAAIEAPAPKKDHKPKPSEDLAALQAKVADLTDELKETLAFSESLEEADKILTADDKTAQAWAEVKKLKEENRVLRERVNGLMSEKNEMTKEAKQWMRKFQALEKRINADLAEDTTFQKGA